MTTVAEQIKIIGYRQGQTSVVDVVNLEVLSVRFETSNPILNLPIPSTGNAAEAYTNLINLRRITTKIIIDGFITDTTYYNSDRNTQTCYAGTSDGSARAVTYNSNGTLTYSNSPCTGVQKAIEKKWILEQFAAAGTNSGFGLSVIWRNIYDPAGTDYVRNRFNKNCFISELTITDTAQGFRTNNEFQYPQKFAVKITLVTGIPVA